MGKYDHDNAAINSSYLFRELTPKISASEYVKGQTIPGFLLGYPSVKAIRSMNLHILESHKRAIACGFSSFFKDDKMSAEDLDMDRLLAMGTRNSFTTRYSEPITSSRLPPIRLTLDI